MLCPPSECPALVDRGRTEPCDADQEQAEGHEGLEEGMVMTASSQVKGSEQGVLLWLIKAVASLVALIRNRLRVMKGWKRARS